MARETDWEKVEADYRAGSLSVNEIARQAGVDPSAVRHRAKRYGWVRDLSDQVRAATKAKLVTDAVTPGVTPLRAGEIIESAATVNVEVVRSHRKDLTDLRTRARALQARFDEMLPLAVIPKDLAMLADVLTDAAAVIGKAIPLERQAFNLDDPATHADNDLNAEQRRKAAELYLEG